MPFRWPFSRDAKQAAASPTSAGLVAWHGQAEPRWTRADYAALAREGYMRNPVVYRSVRLIAEAAAAVPWLLYRGAAGLDRPSAAGAAARAQPAAGRRARSWRRCYGIC